MHRRILKNLPPQKTARYRARNPEKVKLENENRDWAAYRRDHKNVIKKSTQKYRTSPKYRKTYINSHLKRKYGITFDDYQKLYDAQGGKCKICDGTVSNRKWKDGRTQWMKLFVDHDHKTGKVRGLLCNTCNFGIAALKDNVEILQSAIRYLTASMKVG